MTTQSDAWMQKYLDSRKGEAGAFIGDVPAQLEVNSQEINDPANAPDLASLMRERARLGDAGGGARVAPQPGGLSMDSPGALALLAQSDAQKGWGAPKPAQAPAPQAQGALTQTARAEPDFQAMLNKFVPQDDSMERYLAMSAAFTKPNVTGSFGETMNNVSNALLEQKQNQAKLRAQYTPLIMQQVAAQQARDENHQFQQQQNELQRQQQLYLAQQSAADRIENARLAREQAAALASRHDETIRLGQETKAQTAADALALRASQDAPKLKQGEKWNPETKTVEVIPGSDLWQKQKSAHAKDFGTVQNAVSSMDTSIAKVDDILDPKNADAFNSNFGGYNAMATQYFPGASTDMRKKIESIKSDLKMAGLNVIRAGGSVGAMTEKEWPIVEGMISRIDPTLGEDAARSEFNKVKTYMARIKDNAVNLYQTEWEGSPHYKGAAPVPVNGAPTAPVMPSPADIAAEIARRKKG